MENSSSELNKVHWSFWLLGIIGLLWNMGGAANYIMQTSSDMVAQMPPSHQAIIQSRPAWATAGFAVGVFIGAIGCLLLLLKRRLAKPVLLISLVGIVLAVVHTIIVAVSGYKFSGGELAMMVLMPFLVGVALWRYSLLCAKKGWLK